MADRRVHSALGGRSVVAVPFMPYTGLSEKFCRPEDKNRHRPAKPLRMRACFARKAPCVVVPAACFAVEAGCLSVEAARLERAAPCLARKARRVACAARGFDHQ